MYQIPTSARRFAYVTTDQPVLHPCQLRLGSAHTIKTALPQERDTGYGLSDLKAFAIDPDVESRRMAALSLWAIDADLQLTLAHDPDELVVLDLLSNVDPHRDASLAILASSHQRARRRLAGRNLSTATLLTIADDPDPVVRAAARQTLERRGALA